ncbi:MAG: MBL fold metallo-hydrolase [Candidatus Aminicenantes bacterium]|nr:MBL fold metallo-hydrolase [Candidatus Aminicenantes bacterium]
MRTHHKFLLILFVMISFVLSLSFAQREAPPLEIIKVKKNIYEVSGGSGANTGFFIGENQVLVIDAKMSKESAKQMIEKIKKLTPNPVMTVVLTHSDGDHVNGLSGFPQGISIISHHNTRKHMDKAFEDQELRKYLPNQTFHKELNLHLGTETIKLLHFTPAHTNGDIVVFFPKQKVVFLGDLIFLNRDPLIHKHKNGNSFGLVKTLKGILDLDAETFVHGHGGIAQRKDILNMITSLEQKQEKIKTLIQNGKSLDEVKKEFGVPEGQSRWPSIVEIIYKEIKEIDSTALMLSAFHQIKL